MSANWYVWIAVIAIVCLMIFFGLRSWSRREEIAASNRAGAPQNDTKPQDKV